MIQCPGCQLTIKHSNHMMQRLLLKEEIKNSLHLLGFIVLRLSVHLVTGVVIAWAKFTNAESPTNILNFLEHVYPTEESRPAYICIDKACLVLRTSVVNGTWDSRWKNTSRFIVDSYHYVNHRATDHLCRKWCNPAPLDGSHPNLVIVETDERGRHYFKRAFNTQACEQLNAWLGGFDHIIRRMTSWNFNWFLHTMLFYHTKEVIKRLGVRQDGSEDEHSADDDDE